jgi:hypothetical protein
MDNCKSDELKKLGMDGLYKLVLGQQKEIDLLIEIILKIASRDIETYCMLHSDGIIDQLMSYLKGDNND